MFHAVFLVVVAVVVAVVCTCGTAGSPATVCQDLGGKRIPNMCSSVAGRPFCVKKRFDGGGWKYQCAECEGNCDCEIGRYCVKTAGWKTGSCLQIDSARFGKSCNRFRLHRDGLPWNEPVSPVPAQNVDSGTVCGLPIFAENGNFSFYEWIGYCDAGTCRQCENSGERVGDVLAHLADAESLLCPGRRCWNGKLYLTPDARKLDVYGAIPNGVIGAILAFVVLLTVVFMIFCVHSIRSKGRLYIPITKQTGEPHEQ